MTDEPAARGEHPLRGQHAVDVVGGGLGADQDDGLALPGGGLLYAGDTPANEPYEGIKGVSITVDYATVADAERVFDALAAMEEATPHVLLATGRLVGEGFDHPPLDTLALAMPISWKGTLQQYAGRLHRSHADKQDVRIYDYVDTGHAQLARMWEKRQRGYRAMGYRILPGAEAGDET